MSEVAPDVTRLHARAFGGLLLVGGRIGDLVGRKPTLMSA
jgi:hypothetical protein